MAGESAREEARRAREKAERLTRRAAMFERGADGEAATAALLAGLPPHWSAIHDVRWPGRRFANIDHIVIGPGGIFVVDSKNWSGRITVDGGRLRQNGRSREKEVAKCADAALAVAELAGPYAERVVPVLCFMTEEPVSGWSRDVMLCSTATLDRMLRSRPVVMSESHSQEACLRLDAQLRAAVAAEGQVTARPRGRSVSHPMSTATRSGTRRRSRRRRAKALRWFAFRLALLAVLVLYGPAIAKAVGGIVVDQLTSGITACDHPASSGPTPETTGGAGANARADGQPSAPQGPATKTADDDC